MRLPRFTIRRLMIAVLAISLIASNVRFGMDWDRSIHFDRFRPPRSGWTPWGLVLRVPVAVQLGASPLAILTVGWAALVIRREPAGGRICRDAGALACVTASIGLFSGILLTWLRTACKSLVSRGFSARAWADPFVSDPWAIVNAGVHAIAPAVGYAVATAWICLKLLSGPEDREDRGDLAGRILGVCWLLMALNELALMGVVDELIRLGW